MIQQIPQGDEEQAKGILRKAECKTIQRFATSKIHEINSWYGLCFSKVSDLASIHLTT